jgi:hypothetical protein
MDSELPEEARADARKPTAAAPRHRGLRNYPLLVALRRRPPREPGTPKANPSGTDDLAMFRGVTIAIAIALLFWAIMGLALWLLFK